jgi:hypothetical protein
MKDITKQIGSIIGDYIGLVGIMLMLSIGITVIQMIASQSHQIHTRELNQYEQLGRLPIDY